MRSIELNPVRAGMVTDLAHYCGSSYRHKGLGQADERLAAHPLHQSLGMPRAASGLPKQSVPDWAFGATPARGDGH
jgi:hypothetical protein